MNRSEQCAIATECRERYCQEFCDYERKIRCMENVALFEYHNTLSAPLFSKTRYPYEVLNQIFDFICKKGRGLPQEQYVMHGEGIWIHKSAEVAPTAYIVAPCIIGANVKIRHCALLRGNVIAEENCVIGNSCEVKNSVLLCHVQIPHFNYVGDSVLGNRVHFGAGVITANVKSDKSIVKIKGEGYEINTCLKKVGAFVGDGTEVGCNCVLFPGTVIGKNTTVYPLCSVRKTIASNTLYKGQNRYAKKV